MTPLLGTLKDNWRKARISRHEISGSLGDMGLFVPLLVGMASTCGLNFAVALFFAGEALAPMQWMGGLAAVGGIYLVNISRGITRGKEAL